MQLSSQPVIVDDAFDGRRTAAAVQAGGAGRQSAKLIIRLVAVSKSLIVGLMQNLEHSLR